MFRKVFFSFHYEKDAWRAGVVRNHGITKASVQHSGYVDSAAWETIKRGGEAAIRRWIDQEMFGTSVTVVLIGSETAQRDWVKYEIEKTLERGNALLGIRIHEIKNQLGQTDLYGSNPFDHFSYKDPYWGPKPLSQKAPVYNWIGQNGYENFPLWIQQAARIFEK